MLERAIKALNSLTAVKRLRLAFAVLRYGPRGACSCHLSRWELIPFNFEVDWFSDPSNEEKLK